MKWFKLPIKKFLRWLTAPIPIISILVIITVAAVILISLNWRLEPDQILTVTVAALAFPIALLTQRAILIENQKHELSRKGYESLQDAIMKLNAALVSVTISKYVEDGECIKKIVEKTMELRESIALFTNTYHTHEMVFIKSNLYFKYIHYSASRLAKLLDNATDKLTYDGYGDTIYNDEASKVFEEAIELADNLLAYIYDLQKELIEDLGFSKIFNTVIERRVPKNKKYKTLSDVATRSAIKELEKDATR